MIGAAWNAIRLEVTLLSGDAVTLHGKEFFRVARHRYILLNYLLLALVISLVNMKTGDYAYSMAIQAQVTLAGVVFGICCVLAVPTFRWWQLRRTGGLIRLHASPLLAVAVCATVFGTQGLLGLAGMKPYGIGAVLVMAGYFYVISEVFFHFLALVVLPRVLRDLRGTEMRPERGARTGAGGEVPRRAEREAAPTITIKGEPFRAAALWYVRADGNYILVRSEDRRAFLPGPFGPVVDALPEALGLQVSRSDWVARVAVSGMQRNGREVVLDLVDGTSVKVAESRRKAVQSWLERTAPPVQGAGAEISTQTG
ncbi:MAG: LytTR family DNA-binding domain-containing protein [Paracoccaceae bacterium]